MSDDPAEKDESLTVAVKTCLRGKSITRGLLTFARRNDGHRELNQIRDAVEETLALVERELGKVNVRVERRLQPVPQTVCDLGQISQVLLNLITNARDAMLDGGGGVIAIDLAQQGDWIKLAVSDTGSGIPEHMLSQIFQPFVTTKGALGGSTVPGTGLGLSIARRVTELPVNHRARKYGTSKYGINRTIKVLLDLLTLKFLSSYSTKPIQLFGGLGALCFLFGSLATLFTLYSRVFEDVRVHRNPVALIAIFLFLAGLLPQAASMAARTATRAARAAVPFRNTSIPDTVISPSNPW